MRKMLLTLIAVFSIANLSLADYLPTLRQIDNGNPNVLTYIVGLESCDVGGISAIANINVTGDVCQVGIAGVVPTPDMTYVSFLQDKADLDTHLLDLSHLGTGIIRVGDGWTEDNDRSDPANLSGATGGFLVSGIGDLYLIGTETVIAVKNPPVDLCEMEFIQVAIPYDPSDPTRYSATVTGLYSNPVAAEAGEPMFPFSIYVGIVPEPSTIVLLLCGGFCLAGVRGRRK